MADFIVDETDIRRELELLRSSDRDGHEETFKKVCRSVFLQVCCSHIHPRSIQAKERVNSALLKWYFDNKLGVAFHHAGVSKNDRELIQQMFIDGHIRVIVSTA